MKSTLCAKCRKAIKRDFAKERKQAFFDAIHNETYGKCPKPPETGVLLRDSIGMYVSGYRGRVVVRGLSEWNRAEIEYVLKVVRKLGFTPKWSE